MINPILKEAFVMLRIGKREIFYDVYTQNHYSCKIMIYFSLVCAQAWELGYGKSLTTRKRVKNETIKWKVI